MADGDPAGLSARPEKSGKTATASNNSVTAESNLNASAWLISRPADDGRLVSAAPSPLLLRPEGVKVWEAGENFDP